MNAHVEAIEDNLERKFKDLTLKLKSDQEDGRNVYEQIMNNFDDELKSIFPDKCSKLKPACDWICSKRGDMEAAMTVLQDTKFSYHFDNEVEPSPVSYNMTLVPGGPKAMINFCGNHLEVFCLISDDIIIKSAGNTMKGLLTVQAEILKLGRKVTFTLGEPETSFFLYSRSKSERPLKSYSIKLNIRYTSFKAGYENLISHIENSDLEFSSISWKADEDDVDTSKIKSIKDIGECKDDPDSYFSVAPQKSFQLS